MANNAVGSLLFLVLATVVVGCNSSGTTPASAPAAPNPAFDSFSRNFRQAELPLTIKACYADVKSYVEVSKDKYPQYVQNQENFELAGPSIKPNGDYTALIVLCPGDCYLPKLTTYDRAGKVIDEKILGIGGCGSDCGFTCEEYMILRPDYSIYASDTITQIKCDTTGNEIPGTKEHYVIYKQGKLLSSGKIELSGEIKLPLKN